MCKYKIVISSILKNYVLHLYHSYLLHPEMDRTEGGGFQNIYCPEIRNAVPKGSN